MIARSWSKMSDLKILDRQIQDRFETKSTHLRDPGARNEDQECSLKVLVYSS
jgi:hypothetical protein